MEPIKQVTILLVEDDPGDQKLTKKAISDAKIVNDVMVADSGESAFEYLSHCKNGDNGYPRPDLILLDLNMPGMGGKEFLHRIKIDDDFGMIPVVILTTSDLDNDIRESYKLHASGYIKKPVTLQGFQKIMLEFQEYWFSICKLG
jgi:CheY-like chemotaxis protein